ncbi:MobF family relaxase [Actinosynnema sp. NPDC059335]|uniref:MobF family relaxase n=1 Tax=Actinosynnema sp. NPDC059335 TaxID=3346804 RepID=UPI00366BA638
MYQCIRRCSGKIAACSARPRSRRTPPSPVALGGLRGVGEGPVGGVLRLTTISAGRAGAEYLLRAAGCAEHDHAQHSRDASSPGAEYLLGGSSHGEPMGVWYGSGLEMLADSSGAVPGVGDLVTAEQMRAVYGELRHWELDPATGKPIREFGSRPRTKGVYASPKERLEAALAAEPTASEERRAEIERELQQSQRQSVGYYDLSFMADKSTSVWKEVLKAAGLHDQAAAVDAAHDQAVREALDYIDAHVTTTRVGRHSTITLDDGSRRTTGEMAGIKGLVMTLWRHSTSRDGDPHLHTHAAILNRTEVEGGGVYAVDGQQFKDLKGTAAIIYERRMEQLVTEATGARYGWRPDGQAREIVGMDRVLLEESSGRAAAMKKELDKLVEDYVDTHGHEPSREALGKLRANAWYKTRQPKTMLSPEALAERYARKHGTQKLVDQVDAVRAAARKADVEGVPGDAQRRAMGEDELLRTAVARVQEKYATWDRTGLALEVNKLVGEVNWGSTTAGEVDRLLDRALAPGGPADVVALVGKVRAEAPAALRVDLTPEGAPVYQVAAGTRYATAAHIGAEKELVAQAHRFGGPRLAVEREVAAERKLREAGLGPDQVRAATGILSSGKAADVLIGPAGAGKSKTLSWVDRLWREEFSAPVLGLATSQRATEVLISEGLEAINVAQFLTKYTGENAEQLAPRTLLVVDEAGMADTDKLAEVSRLVHAAGGKLLYTGDHEQLAAVGSGGMLRLLTRDATPFELTQVWRFRSEWEREASLKMRDGDPAAIAEYQRHGRIRGGTKQEMIEAAVRGYLADVLDGKESVLVVRTNEDAALVSGMVRDELVALDRVGEDVLAIGGDDNPIGRGDVIAARLNDHRADTQNKKMVVNRELLTVEGRNAQGQLIARRHSDDTRVYLRPDYVRHHTTLAYAGTGHSVQGRTTDTDHDLVERGMSRNELYPGATRGRSANHLYVVTEAEPDAHNPETYSVSPADVLREVLATDGGQVSATETWRAALEADDSLAQMGQVWGLAAREAMEHHHHDVLLSHLGPDRMEWVTGEDGHRQLMATLAHAELSGHDVERVLAGVLGPDARALDDVESMSAVLAHRVREVVQAAGDPPVPGPWSKRLRSYAGTISEYAQELGTLMDQRVDTMARALVIEPPDWALVQLGPVPADDAARRQWVARAAAVGAYREMYGVDPEQMTIGPAPSRVQDPVKHVTWHRAWEALGRPAEQRDQAELTDEQLREQVARWEREQQWAPAYVAPQLEQTTVLAEEYRRESVTRWAQVDAELTTTRGVITDDLQALIDKAERADRMHARHAEQAARFERLHEARERWAAHTAEHAERAAAAAAELERRGRDLVEPHQPPVQQVLFDVEHAERPDTEVAVPEQPTPDRMVEPAPEPVEPPDVEPVDVPDVEDTGAPTEEPDLVEVLRELAEEFAADQAAFEAELAAGVEGELVDEPPAPAQATQPAPEVHDAEVIEDVAAQPSVSTELEVDYCAPGVLLDVEPQDHQPQAEPEIVDAEIVDEPQSEPEQQVVAPTAVENDAEVEPAVEDSYADVPLPDEPEFADPEPEFEPAFTYDGPLPDQPAGREDDEWTPPVFALHYDKQPEPDQSEQADVDDDQAQVERGDYGTAYRLDDVPEAEATYPAPVEVDEHQTTLFAIDAEVPARVAVGTVRDETTLRDEELRATLSDRTVQGRELRAGLLDERQVLDDEERRRRYWERVDLGHDRSVGAARDRATNRQPQPQPQPEPHRR